MRYSVSGVEKYDIKELAGLKILPVVSKRHTGAHIQNSSNSRLSGDV